MSEFNLTWRRYNLQGNPYFITPLSIGDGFLDFSSFVGRDEEKKQIKKVIEQGSVRSIITGDAGVGKTSLLNFVRDKASKDQYFTTQKEIELNNTIKKLEPLNGNKAKIIATWGKYYAKSVAISMAFSFFWDSVEYGLTGNKKKDDGLNHYLFKAFLDNSPLPFYGFNPSNFMQAPIIPNIEPMVYGNFSSRNLTRGAVDYGLNVVPGLGLVNRVVNRRISNAITDVITPKKKKSKAKQYKVKIP